MPNLLYIKSAMAFYDIAGEWVKFEGPLIKAAVMDGHAKVEYVGVPEHFPCAISPYIKSVVKSLDGRIATVMVGCIHFSLFDMRLIRYPKYSINKQSALTNKKLMFMGLFRNVIHQAFDAANGMAINNIPHVVKILVSDDEGTDLHEDNPLCLTKIKASYDRLDPYDTPAGQVVRISIMTFVEARNTLQTSITEKKTEKMVEKFEKRQRRLKKIEDQLKLRRSIDAYFKSDPAYDYQYYTIT